MLYFTAAPADPTPPGEAPTGEKPWEDIMDNYVAIKAKEYRLEHSYEEYMDPARGPRPVPEYAETMKAMFMCMQSYSLGKDKIIYDLLACLKGELGEAMRSKRKGEHDETHE